MVYGIYILLFYDWDSKAFTPFFPLIGKVMK